MHRSVAAFHTRWLLIALGALIILLATPACGNDDKFSGRWTVEDWQVSTPGDAEWAYQTPPDEVVIRLAPDAIHGFLTDELYDGWAYTDGVVDALLRRGVNGDTRYLDGDVTLTNGPDEWRLFVWIDFYGDPDETVILRLVARRSDDPKIFTEWTAYLRRQ
jgi:hypothetical protein